MVKKLFLLIVIFIMCFGLVGCGKTSNQNNNNEKITNKEYITLKIKGKEIKFTIPCTVSEFKKAGFYFYDEYLREDVPFVKNLKKPGDSDMAIVGIGEALENRHDINVWIRASEEGEINDDTAIVERIIMNAPDDVIYGKNIKYGMNIKDAIEELGNDYREFLKGDDLEKGMTILDWKKNSLSITITAEDGIVEEIDLHIKEY